MDTAKTRQSGRGQRQRIEHETGQNWTGFGGRRIFTALDVVGILADGLRGHRMSESIRKSCHAGDKLETSPHSTPGAGSGSGLISLRVSCKCGLFGLSLSSPCGIPQRAGGCFRRFSPSLPAFLCPVDAPPCNRQRSFPATVRAWQGVPLRVFAPHCGRLNFGRFPIQIATLPRPASRIPPSCCQRKGVPPSPNFCNAGILSAPM